MSNADLRNVTKIGENDYGYWFGVGQAFGAWQGFAVGQINGKDKMIFFLPGCDEYEVAEGKDVREELIKRVGAVAQSPEHGYGGIKRWFVPEELRGKPEDYMCPDCGSVACSGCDDYLDFEDFD